MDVPILHEDEDLLILNKPSGVTVNTSDTTTGETTLQNWVEMYRKLPPYKKKPFIQSDPAEYKSPEEDFADRAGIVHRLDKETSGIILVAKNVASFKNLQGQFKDRTIQKTYLALAHGFIKPTEGEINVPVGRLPWNRKHFGILAGGREAITMYKVLDFYTLMVGKTVEELSFVKLFPKTGRTHQIRVHLQYIHHPIFADFLYAGRKTSRNDRKFLSRVFLHAYSLSFNHPRTHNSMSIEAPLPDELQKVIDACKKEHALA